MQTNVIKTVSGKNSSLYFICIATEIYLARFADPNLTATVADPPGHGAQDHWPGPAGQLTSAYTLPGGPHYSQPSYMNHPEMVSISDVLNKICC